MTNLTALFGKTLVLILFSSTIVFAQNPTGRMDDPQILEGQGKMFQIRYVPGDKQAKLYVVGNKAAQINFNKLNVEAILFINGQEKKLSLTKNSDHFVTDAIQLQKGQELQLKISDDNNHQTEKIKLEIHKP